ncbi:hypothetical protein BOTBODRAFT_35533 [Botryobasidium botryosum FD-172 SS1]|uniref:Amidohydrolase 3 domain-containing protein n=1 Tax=Botryobasidium botryosum (strain FD-172 SS1) TaxID=930990 RepID=A0A067MH44_BOTB1|nr:hypothetical protein BOTBODRAFT_35533 [Botryobasidium botryosum FD-172 SS1]
MFAAQLRRRQATLEKKLERAQQRGSAQEISQDSMEKDAAAKPTAARATGKRPLNIGSFRRPPPPGRGQGRLHAFLSAIVIFTLLFLYRRPSSTLPSSWALCSRDHLIYTVAEPAQVECIVVHDGEIVDSGSAQDIKERWEKRNGFESKPETKDFGLDSKNLKIKWLKPGQAAYPGFADAHAHIMDYGFSQDLSLVGTTSVEEVVDRIRQYILARPVLLNDTSAWIQGTGWDQNKWTSKEFPTARQLDTDILRARPISLSRIDGHALWVSPKAMQLLGETPENVEGGEIIRDELGYPTGIFVDEAMSLIQRVTPPWTQSQFLHYFQTAVTDALKHGLTSIHDAMAFPQHIDFFKQLADEGKLPIRLYLMGHIAGSTYWGGNISKIVNHPSGRISLRSVKLVADGAVGSWGAALLEPYSDNPDTNGILIQSPEALHSLIHDFIQDAWQVNVHCIGDRANNIVLDAFEKALSGKSNADLRLRLEHAQIMTQADIERAGKLKIIASVQPTHATSDMGYIEKRLGPERVKGAYAWRSLLNSGAPLALGSDFPVEGINPLLGFYAAVTRLTPEGDSPHGPNGWYPEQSLTRAEALRGMTLDAAYASFQESTIGSLVPGKRADVVVLWQDIMTAPVDQILNSKVAATIVDGQLAYGKL